MKNDIIQTLYKKALEVRENAYAPYSEFKVGSALIDATGKIHVGCNVEIANYTSGVCSERNAIGHLVASGQTEFKDIVVVTATEKGSFPCGSCRQVLAEFSDRDLSSKVHVANLKEILYSKSLKELLPHAFDKTFLA